MRVTHVITRLIVGGAQENTVASVLGLNRLPGYDVRLITGPTLGTEGSLESRFANHPRLLSLLPSLVRPVHPWKDWTALRALTSRFRQQSPDIVHTHSGKAGVLARLAAHRAGVPIIIHTIHGPSFGPFQGPLSNFLFRQAERLAGRVTTRFVVVADAMKHQYLGAGIGRDSQYTRIFSGFHLDPFLNATNDLHLRARFGFTSDHLVVGMISRLFKLKGHDDLLDIVPRLVLALPRIRFLLIGDGPWRGRLEERVHRTGLDQYIAFAGLVPPPQVPQHVGIMDLLIHLSRREGLPRALPQALAARRPVIAYDCDGASEVCVNSQTGFLVPPGDQNVLVDRILDLANSPELRARLGDAGQSRVRACFSEDQMIRDLHALYQQLSRARGLHCPP
jgi:glycosyltransferase involved in cell wall biosynthesis